jgi:polar amino acid transport system substrate-binding protein
LVPDGVAARLIPHCLAIGPQSRQHDGRLGRNRERILRSLSFTLGLVLFGLQAALPARGDQATLRVGYTDQESPFFIMGNGRAIPPQPGIAVEIVQEAARLCGVKVESARYPGGRLLALLENAEIDSVLMLSFSAERQAIATYPMAGDTIDEGLQLATLSYAFYVREGSRLAWDGKTLSGQTQPVGANLGWSIVNDLKKAGIEVETAQDTRNNFSKLMLDRIDAFAIQSSIGDAYLAAHELEANVTRLEPPISSKPYFQVFSQAWYAANPDAARCLWQKAAEVRARDLPALQARYLDAM